MHDAWFFVGVFAFIFLVWVATGGPTNPLAFEGPRLAQPDELGGGTYLSLPRAPFGVGGKEIQLPGSSTGGGLLDGSRGSGSSSLLPKLPGVSFGTPSFYREVVSVSHYISNPGATAPNDEYLEVSVPQSAATAVNLTGWKIMSEVTGSAATIPKGTKTPTSGVVNEIQDIVLEPGDRAIVSSGYSPIGASFKENVCIGYFSSFQTFSPTLPQNCPTPENELKAFYSTYVRDPQCIDYVSSLNRCQVALSPPVYFTGDCQRFLMTYLHYNGCVDAHKNDTDFEGTVWHVYLGRTKSLFRETREVVKILDARGNTVDAFSY